MFKKMKKMLFVFQFIVFVCFSVSCKVIIVTDRINNDVYYYCDGEKIDLDHYYSFSKDAWESEIGTNGTYIISFDKISFYNDDKEIIYSGIISDGHLKLDINNEILNYYSMDYEPESGSENLFLEPYIWHYDENNNICIDSVIDVTRKKYLIPRIVANIKKGAFSGCGNIESILLPFVGGSRDENTYLGYIFGASSYLLHRTYVPSSLRSIEILDGYTSVCDYAFSNCWHIDNIILGKDVKSIGKSAFSGCTTLKNIEFSESIISIDDNAFQSCAFETISIPNSVKYLGSSAFDSCVNLKSITISKSVVNIGSRCFEGCINLEAIIVDEENEIYDSRNNCNAIIDSQTNTLLVGCLNTVIPNGIRNIGARAFYRCVNLESIIIPDSIINIGDAAFYYCSKLESITIPKSVESIGDYAFNLCNNLETLLVDEENEIYDSRNNCNAIIETQTNSLLVGCLNTVIPNGITSIGTNAFYYCSNLESIVIPNSVNSIGAYAFAHSGLINLDVPEGVKEIKEHAFENCDKLIDVKIANSVTTIGWNTFSQCNNLRNVILSSGTTYLDYGLLESCYNLENVIIPEGVEIIGSAAFSYSNVQNIIIPSTIIEIHQGAFDYTVLLKIYYNGSYLDWLNINKRSTGLSGDYVRYYYSETEPTDEGNYWHYVDGVVTEW